MTAITDAEGNQTTFTYDSEGRVSVSIDPQGRRTLYTYGDTTNAPRQATEIRVEAADGTLLSLQETDYGDQPYNLGKVTEERLLDTSDEIHRLAQSQTQLLLGGTVSSEL